MPSKDPEKKRARERRKYASRMLRCPEKVRAKQRAKKFKRYWSDPVYRQLQVIQQARRRIKMRRERILAELEQLSLELSNG